MHLHCYCQAVANETATHARHDINAQPHCTMTILQSLFFATAMFVSGIPTTDPIHAGAYSEVVPSVTEEVTAERTFETLSGTINNLLNYPAEFSEVYAQPIQEMIVNVRFKVSESNEIEVTDITGSDKQFNRYVEQTLNGQFIGNGEIAHDVTFQTTLRFVR